MFGNVNVDYKPCKSITQLKSAADYILGRQTSQIRDGVVKTSDNLYWGINCDRPRFIGRQGLYTIRLKQNRKTLLITLQNSTNQEKISCNYLYIVGAVPCPSATSKSKSNQTLL